MAHLHSTRSRAGFAAAAAAVLVLVARDVTGSAGAMSALRAGTAALEAAQFEDYTAPAGRMADGELRVALEARPALWQPWGNEGISIYTHVLSAAGEPARIPAPLFRVRAGTPVRVSVRNTFDRPLAVQGFRARPPALAGAAGPGGPPPADTIPPGATVELGFTPGVAGTFVYTGRVLGEVIAPDGLPGAGEAYRGMIGVLIVDPPDATPADERLFLITHWADTTLPGTWLPATRMFINARSWPHTQRLVYEQGDTVRWRVINFTGRPHPMHLHGFYFHVDAHGELGRDRALDAEERPFVVTQVLRPAETMRMSWVADEPGNWVFHCHFMRHMSFMQHAPLTDSGAHVHAAEADELELMGGLVLGITIHPDPSSATRTGITRRRIPLFITKQDSVFGAEPAYAFVMQQGADPPAADSMQHPGSLVELVRGEPTEIVVHNRADVALGVHWHGLELESRGDGVPGWSGAPGAAVPAIRPGDSLRVRITPRRAGSFMYHVHSEPGHQLAAGLYGPLLVSEPDASYDALRDHIFLLGSLGTGDDPPAAINGQRQHPPLTLRAGVTHRLRFMHISPDDDKRVTLLDAAGASVEWEPLAKDGAELPQSARRTLAASLDVSVGETYDFGWAPVPGVYTLRVVTTFDRGAPAFPRAAPPPDTTVVMIRVQ